METSSPPPPAIELSTPLYYHLVYTITDLLPPPLDDTPEGLRARNHAAIAKVTALDQRVPENISENATNSQDAAFETWLSQQPWNRASTGSGETGLSEILPEAMAEARLASRQLPADAREGPSRVSYVG